MNTSSSVPMPPKKHLFPILMIPLLMATLYLLIVYPRYNKDPYLVMKHLFVLSLWLAATLVLMFAVREVFLRLNKRYFLIPWLLVPTASFYFLYFIYTASVVGNLSWGEPADYRLILNFIPHLFDLADNFDIPRGVIVAYFIAPLIVFYLILHGRTRELSVWYWAIREKYNYLGRSQKMIFIFGITACMTIFGLALTSTRQTLGFINLVNEPIVAFFNPRPTIFAMTRERVYWEHRDRLVEKAVRGKIPKVHNIILFCVDALRADHLPIYGYKRPLTPFLDKFFPAAHARRVEIGLSTGIDTLTGTVCLMNSKEPAAVSQYDYSLCDYLADEGFSNYLILAGGHTWQKTHQAFGKKIDLFFDGSENPGPGGICDDQLVVNETANLKPYDGGFHFFYFHLLSVHPLGTLDDKFLRYQPTRNVVIGDTLFLGDTVPWVRNLYDDRILQMDDVMRKILLTLRQKGYLKDYVAVLTADHGQILGKKGKYGHRRFTAIEALHIPIVFFGSKPLPAFPEIHYGTQIDIAPTLTDMVGLDFPSCWQGQSLLRKRTNPWTFHLCPYTQSNQEGAVVYDGPNRLLKYSRTLEDYEDKAGELYDLDKDIHENTNLVKNFDPNFLGQMRSQAQQHFTSY